MSNGDKCLLKSGEGNEVGVEGDNGMVQEGLSEKGTSEQRLKEVRVRAKAPGQNVCG